MAVEVNLTRFAIDLLRVLLLWLQNRAFHLAAMLHIRPAFLFLLLQPDGNAAELRDARVRRALVRVKIGRPQLLRQRHRDAAESCMHARRHAPRCGCSVRFHLHQVFTPTTRSIWREAVPALPPLHRPRHTPQQGDGAPMQAMPCLRSIGPGKWKGLCRWTRAILLKRSVNCALRRRLLALQVQ